MSDDRPTRDCISLEEATISNMWEIAAMAEWRQGSPPLRGTSFGSFALPLLTLCLLQNVHP